MLDADISPLGVEWSTIDASKDHSSPSRQVMTSRNLSIFINAAYRGDNASNTGE
jgi:hypothetical protein